MDLNFSEMSNMNLIELKMNIEKEISRRRKSNLQSLVTEFRDAFMDVNDYMDIQLATCEGDFWVDFSELSFFDKETGEEVNI